MAIRVVAISEMVSGGSSPEVRPTTVPSGATNTQKGKASSPKAVETEYSASSTIVGMSQSSLSSHADGGKLGCVEVVEVATPMRSSPSGRLPASTQSWTTG